MGERLYSAWDESKTVTTDTVDPHSGSLLCEVMGPQVGLNGLSKLLDATGSTRFRFMPSYGYNGLDPVPRHISPSLLRKVLTDLSAS